MTKLPASQVRRDFAEALNRVAYRHERIVLHRRGQDVAALVSLEDLALLEKLEDQLDIDTADKALSDPANCKRLPWGAPDARCRVTAGVSGPALRGPRRRTRSG